MILSIYIKKYKLVTLVLGLTLISSIGFAQKQKSSFGLLASAEFASSYYEKQENIIIDEQISSNYRFGVILGRINDSVTANFKYGIYYQYRSFKVQTKVDELDPNYTDYLTAIYPEYYIIGIPLMVDWKLWSINDFQLRLKTGLSFEISMGPSEYSEYKQGESIKSAKLIGSRDWMTGIPLTFQFGADYKLNKNIRIGLYPSVNIYLKTFNGAAETDFPITYGINLFLFKLPKSN